MRTVIVLSLVLTALLAQAGEFVAPPPGPGGADGADKKPFPWEPWVEDARVGDYVVFSSDAGAKSRITTRDGKQIGIESERLKFTERRTVKSREEEKGLLLVEILSLVGKKRSQKQPCISIQKRRRRLSNFTQNLNPISKRPEHSAL